MGGRIALLAYIGTEDRSMPTVKNVALSGRQSPGGNHVLAALPATDYERLLPHLELIPMPLGSVLYESGGKMSYLYFPTTSIV